jgi:hypothetical protein
MVTPQITVTVLANGHIDTAGRIVMAQTPYVNRAKLLTELNDVDVANSVFSNGATLVYYASTNKFVIEPLDVSEIILTGIDGGLF